MQSITHDLFTFVMDWNMMVPVVVVCGPHGGGPA